MINKKQDMPLAKLIQQAALSIPAGEDRPTPIPEGETQTCLFNVHEIRKICHDDEWWYSVVDVVGALSQTSNPRRYWSDLKTKIHRESGNSEWYDDIVPLKLPGKDGLLYPTDCANAETLFRIIQSVPSPHAEPFKKWLARTAYERVLETQNPEIAIKRAIATYQIQGRDNEWIRRRLETIVSRHELTAEWKDRGVKGVEYAILTDDISLGTFDVTTKQHKEFKGLRGKGAGQNLRDHMTGLELVLTMLGEEATKEIAVETDARGFYRNRDAAKSGGKIAGDTRKQIEQQTKKRILSSSNFLPPKLPESTDD